MCGSDARDSNWAGDDHLALTCKGEMCG
jgi:hypothetical protein